MSQAVRKAVNPNNSVFETYKGLLSEWPAQKERSNSLVDALTNRLNATFTIRTNQEATITDNPSTTTGSYISEELQEKTRLELTALEQLLSNEPSTRFPLDPEGRIMSSLPPERTYDLLNAEASEALSKSNVGPFKILSAYLMGELKFAKK